MCLSIFELREYIEKRRLIVPIATGIIFVGLSVAVYETNFHHGLISFVLGLVACSCIVVLMMGLYADGKQTRIFGLLTGYTMPIFVMHTLFAAPLRVVLLKVGIQNGAIHVVLGIVISFIGPMVAAEIMKKTKWLEFFLYPGKFVKLSEK